MRISNRYELQELLGKGGMGEVYRAHDHLTNTTIALKRVLIDPSVLQLDSQVDNDLYISLATEFKMLASLRHPNIISVLDYGFDADRIPFFTMEYLPNTDSILNAHPGNDLTVHVGLLIQLLQGVDYLHRHGILHRDLKPSNILMTGNQVKIIDFGLAVDVQRANQVAGTIPYIAPEILEGYPATSAADLYSVGLIAYQLFLRTHPFEVKKTLTSLIEDILSIPADCTDLPDVIRPIVERLLAKKPSLRFANANDTLTAFSHAIGLNTGLETDTIRESFLQSAKFVGRTPELNQLTTALEQAQQKNGSVWLVGGESGVGKSRLVDEIRTQALVNGALVLRGQGVATVGLPYQIWREPVRPLLLSITITDLEAGILQEIVPDISHLLRRTIAPIPALTDAEHQQRLILTIVELFKRQDKLVVLLFEDLQWTEESLEPLKQLSFFTANLALLIVGTYRSEERPNLPNELPQAKLIQLERLGRSTMTDLAVSILGDNGRQPEFLDFIEKETEGNALFMVEVLRVLAKDAGSLNEIMEATLPQTVTAGGIQKIIQRRLTQIPDWAYIALEYTAVLGRQLDMSILSHLFRILGDAVPFTDEHMLANWLYTCAEASILELQDGQWQFSHDKIREQVIHDISSAEHINIHRITAIAIEAAYPNDEKYAGILANHWHESGNEQAEIHYAEIAAQQALKVYAIEDAITYFQRILATLNTTQISKKIEILCSLGYAYRTQGQLDQAEENYKQAIDLAQYNEDAKGLAQSWVGMAWVHENQGFYKKSLTSATQSETILRTAEDYDVTLLIEALYQKGWAHYLLGDTALARECGLEGLALSQSQNFLVLQARHLNLLSVVEYYMMGNYHVAEHYQQEALTIHRQTGNHRGEIVVLNNLGENLRLQGNYELASEMYQKSLEGALKIGNQELKMAIESNWCAAQCSAGHYAIVIEKLTHRIAQAPENWYVLPDALRCLAEAHLGLKNFSKALELNQRALAESSSPDYLGRTWHLFAKIAQHMPNYTVQLADGQIYNAQECFTMGLALLQEAEIDQYRAMLLWDWAIYALDYGNNEQGQQLWKQALAIFRQLNLVIFEKRMHAERPAQP